ncbi:hypothetical protein J4E80_009208 [Alternaria sp. BMP 0032]|nr:hypothetical protein J4E80_009208 [Alternaria sp. BMP 0032]
MVTMSDMQEDEPIDARHPPIPDGLSPDSVVGIVTVHHPKAFHANHNTAYRKSRLRSPRAGGEWSLDGCHVFLHLVQGQPCYTIGLSNLESPKPPACDVYLPDDGADLLLFGIVPVWKNGSWRLQSASETITEVNGAPIQFSDPHAQNQFPQAIYLRQNLVNHVFVNGLRVDIFMLKAVRELYAMETAFLPSELHSHLQDVTHRPEAWARNRYLPLSEKVSANTCRVLERFTGKIETAKFFRLAGNRRELRDAEFLKFGKTKVDASVVRYLQSLDINHIPAVITETHEGFKAYAAFEEDIKKQHPRVRFTIASKLLRRLFSALAFLHFHKIVHGNVTKECVLLRLVDYKPEAVLLVDYTRATSFPAGMPEPLEKMIEDGRAAMKIVESCCDIWQLRKAPPKDAFGEAFMAKKTEVARQESALMERVVADFFGPKGESRESEKGKKMLKLVQDKQDAWYSARNAQIHNATRREVGLCRSDMIKKMEHDWSLLHPFPNIGEEQHVILTLGHPYLDGLATKLYHNQWDLPPRDVCTKIQQLAGEVEEPWQTFAVKRTVPLIQVEGGFEERCFLHWLASCCEAYPEWRHAIVEEYERLVAPQHGVIVFADIKKLRGALAGLGTMPEVLHATFTRLTSEIKTQPTTNIEEVHKVSYHLPSRMFNLTQLHRLATPGRLVACIDEGDTDCHDWVEVRGEPKLEGHYITLSLLSDFAKQLGLIAEDYRQTQDFPTNDPADFSRVIQRVVLAHTGLVPWASVTRKGAQFNFHAPAIAHDYESAGAFLSTYFGGMKMLPTMPHGSESYERSGHWSNFKTGREIDEAMEVDKRPILPAKGQLKKSASQSVKSLQVLSPHVDRARLSQTLETRKRARARARPLGKRDADNEVSGTAMQAAKRPHLLPGIQDSHQPNAPSAEEPRPTISLTDRDLDKTIANLERQFSSGEPLPQISHVPDTSFFTRNNGVNTNVLSSPPAISAIEQGTFTVVSDDEVNLDDDYKQAEEWLKHVEEDDAPRDSGIFGLNFHHTFREQGDGLDAEGDESGDEDGGGATPVASDKAKQIDLPALKLKDNSAFAAGLNAMATTRGMSNAQAVSQSFPVFQPAPKQSSPPFARPAFLATLRAESGAHRRNDISISDLANVSFRVDPARSDPPPPAMDVMGSEQSPPPSAQPQRVDDSFGSNVSGPNWRMTGECKDSEEEEEEDGDLKDFQPGERLSQGDSPGTQSREPSSQDEPPATELGVHVNQDEDLPATQPERDHSGQYDALQDAQPGESAVLYGLPDTQPGGQVNSPGQRPDQGDDPWSQPPVGWDGRSPYSSFYPPPWKR